MTEESSLISLDDVLDTAFDIFYEMAEDNLEYDDLRQYQEHFDQQGAGVVVDTEEDWYEHAGADIDLSECAEVRIGFADETSLNDVLVRMLLSRNPDNKFCHLLWKRKQ